MNIEMLGAQHADGGRVMVPQKHERTGFPDKIDAFVGVRAIADDVAKTEDFFNLLCFDIGENCFQRFDVGVDV
jgi:hypothetical protein